MFHAPLRALALSGSVVSLGLLAAAASLASPPAQDAPDDEPKTEAADPRELGQAARELQSAFERFQVLIERASKRGGESPDPAEDARAAELEEAQVGKLLEGLRRLTEDADDSSSPSFASFAEILEASEPDEKEEAAEKEGPTQKASVRDKDAKGGSASRAHEEKAASASLAPGGFGGGGGGGFSGPSAEEVRRKIAGLAAVVGKVDENPASLHLNEALAQPTDLKLGESSSLGDLLDQVKKSIQTADGKKIPVYVDPIGLEDADATLESPVAIDLEGVPLKVSLRLALKQLGLAYCVRDGVLFISSREGVLQELEEAEQELIGLHPDKVIYGRDMQPKLMGGAGGMGGMGGGMMGGGMR